MDEEKKKERKKNSLFCLSDTRFLAFISFCSIVAPFLFKSFSFELFRKKSIRTSFITPSFDSAVDPFLPTNSNNGGKHRSGMSEFL